MIIGFQDRSVAINFAEVAAIATIENDVLQSKNSKDDLTNKLLLVIGDGVLYERQQFFELDRCQMDVTTKQRFTRLMNDLNAIKRDFESRGEIPDEAMAYEFNQRVENSDLGMILDRKVPPSIQLDFEGDDLRSSSLKIVHEVPFAKMRNKLLNMIEEISAKEGFSVADIQISSFLRFLPPSLKTLPTSFSQTMQGLHVN